MNFNTALWPRIRQARFLPYQHGLSPPLKTLQRRPPLRKWQSGQANAPSSAASAASRFDRFIARTPTKFLRTRLQALKNAPLTHITSFLILHEITAVVPLFGLAGAFHYYHWLPPFFAEGEWVLKGVTLFGNYFRRKGWITSSDAANAQSAAEEGRAEEIETGSTRKDALGKWWNRGEGGTRLVIEFATAYAVVKALMPLRIVISIWGAPWFARWSVIPVRDTFKRIIGRSKAAQSTAVKASSGKS